MPITSWLRSKKLLGCSSHSPALGAHPRCLSMVARVDRICVSIEPDLCRTHVPDQSSPNRREIFAIRSGRVSVPQVMPRYVAARVAPT